MDNLLLHPEARATVWDRVCDHFPRQPATWDISADGRVPIDDDAPLLRHGAPVLGLSFSPDGLWLAAAGGGAIPRADATVRCWNVETGDTLVCRGHAAGVFAVAFDPRTGVLASASHDFSVLLWNLEAGDAVFLLGEDSVAKQGLAFATTRPWLAIGDGHAYRGRQAALRVLDLTTGQTVFQHTLPPGEHVQHLALSPDGTTLVAATLDADAYAREVVAWRLPEGEVLWRFDRPEGAAWQGLALDPARDRVLLAWRDADDVRWLTPHALADGRALDPVSVGRGLLGALAVSHEADLAATVGEDALVRVFELGSLTPTAELPVAATGPTALAFSPAGDLLAVGTVRRTVALLRGPFRGRD